MRDATTCDEARAANNRYLAFVSEIEDPTVGLKQLNQVVEPV